MKACSGFSLVELLVAITILALLIALLLPAVVSSREAARRAQCGNNMRQLGLAATSYESQYECFPPSSYFTEGVDPAYRRTHERNWVIAILPFLEQQALYDAFDFLVPISDSSNREPRGKELPSMQCPSDIGQHVKFASTSAKEGDNWARGNYAANASLAAYYANTSTPHAGAGTKMPLSYSRWTRGIMGANLSMGISEIHDGASNTILLSEVRVGLTAEDSRGAWALSHPGSSALWAHAWGVAVGPNPCHDSSDQILDCTAVVNRVGLAATRTACMACTTAGVAAQAPPKSQHQGGVQVTMADGSVRFISNYIQKGDGAWWASPTTPNLASQFLCWERLCASQDGCPVDARQF